LNLIKIAIAFLIVAFSNTVSTAQTINTEPLDAYWQMVDKLKQGDSLSRETWKRFLKIEANETYVKNQGFDSAYLEGLRKAIEIVYMPKYDSLLRKRVKDTMTYWRIYKVNNYKVHEKELKDYQNTILQPGYFDSLYNSAWEWLPKRLHKKDSSTTIYLLGIENDAIAGGHTMILTLWTAYNQDKLKSGILTGHEMHHILRKPVEFKNVEDQDKGIIYALNVVLNEGSADMIDKKINLANKANLPFELYFADLLLEQADSIINQLDSNLIKMAESGGKTFKTERDYRNLIKWTSGHCPGYYMADIIVRNGYKKQLVENVQNPFLFIYLYNQAAKKDQKHPPVFSATAIAYVKHLEKKYWGKEE